MSICSNLFIYLFIYLCILIFISGVSLVRYWMLLLSWRKLLKWLTKCCPSFHPSCKLHNYSLCLDETSLFFMNSLSSRPYLKFCILPLCIIYDIILCSSGNELHMCKWLFSFWRRRFKLFKSGVVVSVVPQIKALADHWRALRIRFWKNAGNFTPGELTCW